MTADKGLSALVRSTASLQRSTAVRLGVDLARVLEMGVF